MKLRPSHPIRTRASVLIIVMWVTFGLLAMTIYFANSMTMDLRAADNQVASMEADQAIESAALYVSNILANRINALQLPDTNYFHADGVKVGDATFWLIGRDTNSQQISMDGDYPVWGLIDENSKLNLNNATAAMLINLPGMDDYTAAATFDWQTNSTTPSTDGAKDETYTGLPTPYLCKSAPYETADELRLVYGMNMDLLYGEDANLNGLLDPNENDGMTLPPDDNQDGVLNPGLLEYVTTWTQESLYTTNGQPRIVVTNTTALQSFIQTNFASLSQYLTPFGIGSGGGGGTSSRGGGGGSRAQNTTSAPTSVLDFYVRSGMPLNSFEQIEPYLMNASPKGLININTASEAVLGCIPGIGSNAAPQVLSYRQSNPPQVPTVAWLSSALGGNQTACAQAGPYITAFSYQVMADVVALGHHNRGYRRVRFIFDCSSGVPLIVYRQDLTNLGWALGKKMHDQLLADTK